MNRRDRACTVAECAGQVWAREFCRKHYMRWHQHGDPNTVLLAVSPAGSAKAFMDGLPAEGEGCVQWPFTTNGAGYAQINLDGRKHLVTRLICERAHGAPPSPDHEAAHSCGRGHEACVAPWHLRWLTHAENMAETAAHGTRREGEACATKLTASAVRAIRGDLGRRRQADIAAEHGISQPMVSRIACGRAWASVR